jgi:dCTP deaminase
MGLKADNWIKRMASEHGMIEPFVDGQVRDGVISYGISSYGYDIRVASSFKIFTNVYSRIVDPKQFDPQAYVDFEGDICVIPPNSFVLAESVEMIRMPRNVTGLVLCKSCGRADPNDGLRSGVGRYHHIGDRQRDSPPGESLC